MRKWHRLQPPKVQCYNETENVNCETSATTCVLQMAHRNISQTAVAIGRYWFATEQNWIVSRKWTLQHRAWTLQFDGNWATRGKSSSPARVHTAVASGSENTYGHTQGASLGKRMKISGLVGYCGRWPRLANWIFVNYVEKLFHVIYFWNNREFYFWFDVSKTWWFRIILYPFVIFLRGPKFERLLIFCK